MAKKAFVIGANCKKLEYAESDAAKIRQALSDLGYEVAELTTATEQSHELVQRFRKFAASCKSHDTLIFYFAGHGVSHNGTLYLALNSSDLAKLTASAIPLTDITTTLQGANAQNRLIILDCCEAGDEHIKYDHAANYQLLRPTEKWQHAREFDELNAGFLSYHLHQLLTEPVRHLLDNKHRLTITALERELLDRVVKHNRDYPEKCVPAFVTVGKRNSDYEIATLTPRYAGLLAITPSFLAKEQIKHEALPHTYCEEQFYGANPQVQWWGVTQGLVAKRHIYQRIKDHIGTTLQKHTHKPIITLLLGSGGMGKSTLLRQLAVDLAKDHPVFWLEDWESFAEQQIGELLASEAATALICLDNWHRFETDEKHAMNKWWQQQTELHGKVKWLLSDRVQAQSDLEEFIYGGGNFNLDVIGQQEKQQDNVQLLANVTERLESWQATVASLTSHNITQAKPFHLLFILFRWAGREQRLDFQDFEGVFRQLIRDDIESLHNNEQCKGFADALIDFAALFIRFKVQLTQVTFLRLADFYRHEDYLLSCYQATTPQEEIWGVLRYYLSVLGTTSELSGNETILKFVKEDLAEAIVDIFGNMFEQRKQRVCRFIVDDDSQFSASKMLKGASLNHIFNAETSLTLIKKLLNKRNGDSAYLHFLFNSTSPLIIKERETLLEKFIAITQSPIVTCRYLGLFEVTKAQQKATEILSNTQNEYVICKCFNILGKTAITQQKATELLVKTQDYQVIFKCFDLLGKTEMIEKRINELLSQENQNPFVICKCFNILGKTEAAEERANELLTQKNQTFKVICKCFDFLGKPKAQQKAIELLVKTQDYQVIFKCFDLLGKTEMIEKRINDLLAQENQNSFVICKCFDILGKTAATQQKATELLAQDNQSKELICKCFDLLGKTAATQQKATELLAQGNQDVQVICKCFAILGKEERAKKHARQLLLHSDNEAILAWCVNILEEEAKPFALKRLENWSNLTPKLRLLQNCIYVCRNEKPIAGIVEAIIKQKNSARNRYISVLKLPLSHLPIWQKETTSILSSWKTCTRAFVGASLLGNQNDLSKVKQTCQQILLNWEREINYQQKKGLKVYHFHIYKALSYPSADDAAYRKLVINTAQDMLAKEAQTAGFLGDMLYEAAYNIVNHQQYPAWTPEEET
ncbi:MAG: caspase family protein [Methylococcales bacterium]|nr:caspase family protein [Methylococcales bacterium]